MISVCTGKAECKQTEQADEKQPSSYSYRWLFLVHEIAAIK